MHREQRNPWELYQPNSKLLRILPLEISQRFRVLPIDLSPDKLTLATTASLSAFALAELKAITTLETVVVIWESATWERYSVVYQQSMQFTSYSARPTLGEEGNGQEIVRLTEAIISTAWRRRASDIHLEPQREGLLVRFRIDGLLQEYTFIGEEQAMAVIARLKILSQMDVSQKYEPQDGHLEMEIEGQILNLRAATLPVYRGEKMVLRFLYREVIELTLDQLGLVPAAVEQVQHLVSRPHGLILVTGPTGCGKTTTLYAALNYLKAPSLNITSIEDPIEYELPGINQIAVNVQRGMTFAQGLRGILRQDPDIIMIGEIRDKETADVALRAAITGRLVLSSLHTNDACGAMLRLLDMGIEPYVITAALTAVIGQRLVRQLCPHCKTNTELHRAPWTELFEAPGAPWNVYQAVGCDYCHGTGYYNRSGIFEIMEVNEAMQSLIMRRPELSQVQQLARQNNWRPLVHDGWRQITAGMTDVAELTRVLYV